MDLTALDWIINQSGLAIFASFALYISWHQHRDGLKRERHNAEVHRHDKTRVTDVLEDVTRSNTELAALIREMRQELKDKK